MQEPRTWREFLGKIIEDPREKQQLANLLGVNERTLDRWATGHSNPRSTSHVRQLLKALPHHRAALSELMRQDFPDAVEQAADEDDIFIDGIIKDVPTPFYKRVLETHATAVEPVRTWSIGNLVLQQLSQHLDIDHQGVRVLLMRCLAFGEKHEVHSLRLLFEHTSGHAVSENWPFFCGAESLAGQAVMTGTPQIRQMLFSSDVAAYAAQHFPPRSAAAYPIQRAGRCAGSLLVLSSRASFFTHARLTLIQQYVHLLTLAFQEREFYAQAEVALELMPTESAQHYLLDTFKERTLVLFCQARERGDALTWLEAEQLATQQVEVTFKQLSQQSRAVLDDE
ncbi:MAG: hypothetical protein PVS3B1_28620 [Ktedonobacteraceae bacterium]